MADIDDINKLFKNEFKTQASLFVLFNLSAEEAITSKEAFIWHPGVYVWWHPDRGTIKVGRHLTNSRKRALEHIQDNTGQIMQALGNDSKTRLLLFNVIDPDNKHWVGALEIFFELHLHPLIKSVKLG